MAEPSLAPVLALLEQRHGIGAGGETPGWLRTRLARALQDSPLTRNLSPDAAARRLGEHPDACQALIECLRVGETRLFRDPALWSALAGWLSERGRSRCRVLSVGCSTGEEVWTAAMVLQAARVTEGSVVGLDRSAPSVATARLGAYPSAHLDHLPELYRPWLREAGSGCVEVVDALRQRVSFVVQDATQGSPKGPFDLVLCRNVLIYLGHDPGARLVGRLIRSLTRDGLLLVARAEVSRVRQLGHRPVALGPTVKGFPAMLAGQGGGG